MTHNLEMFNIAFHRNVISWYVRWKFSTFFVVECIIRNVVMIQKEDNNFCNFCRFWEIRTTKMFFFYQKQNVRLKSSNQRSNGESVTTRSNGESVTTRSNGESITTRSNGESVTTRSNGESVTTRSNGESITTRSNGESITTRLIM